MQLKYEMQPVIDTGKNTVLYFELLLRTSGVPHSVSDVLLLEELAKTDLASRCKAPIGINLGSEIMQNQPDFERILLEVVKKNHGQVYVEWIEEPVQSKKEFDFADALNRLHLRGLKLAIDDIPVGHPPREKIALLNKQPEVLKIDGDFFSNSTHEERYELISSLPFAGSHLVIEKIESGHDKLAAKGFSDFMQGFYFSRLFGQFSLG